MPNQGRKAFQGPSTVAYGSDRPRWAPAAVAVLSPLPLVLFLSPFILLTVLIEIEHRLTEARMHRGYTKSPGNGHSSDVTAVYGVP